MLLNTHASNPEVSHHVRDCLLQLHGLPDISLSESSRPLILLNDKRHGSEGQPDRRMIMNIDEVTSRLSGIYRTAEVKAIRFRDLSMNEQVSSGYFCRKQLASQTAAATHCCPLLPPMACGQFTSCMLWSVFSVSLTRVCLGLTMCYIYAFIHVIFYIHWFYSVFYLVDYK